MMTDKNRNLLIRVATALVLLPLILWLIWLGGVWLALLLGAAAALCALELNLLPSSLPAAPPSEEGADLSRKQRKKQRNALEEEIDELETESAMLSGAAIASIGGAFLLPLLTKFTFTSSRPSW